MKLDVLFTPAGLTLAEVQGRTVFVIDILRATTSMCAALHNGAKAIIPVASTEEALRLAQTLGSEDVLLAGEKNCLRIEGFQLGNSPLEMTEQAVRGKTLVLTTTNGTKALLASQGAAAAYPVCAGNLTLAAERAREALEREGGMLVAVRRPRRRLLAGRRLYRGAADRRGARISQGPAQLQRRRARESRPGAPLRRQLGAPAPAEPRRPGAGAAGLRGRRGRRGAARRLSGASLLPRATRDGRGGAGMSPQTSPPPEEGSRGGASPR